MRAIRESLAGGQALSSRWRLNAVAMGQLEYTGRSLRLVNAGTTSRQMTNAQIDDYQGVPRWQQPWRPPLRMTVHARFSHPAADGGSSGSLSGTAGFGFWNDPLSITRLLPLALPRAMWFFYASPPSDMKLDLTAPGRGWKAATIDTSRPSALLWAPAAPLVVPLMNVRPIYRRLWPAIQRSLAVCESPIQVDMMDWHTYVLEWNHRSARFTVDGATALTCDRAPRGPLGFVMWLDNQYMVATPWGKFRYGWLEEPDRQWLEVDTLSIEPGQESGLATG